MWVFLTKWDQLYGFLSKIVDFIAILRKKRIHCFHMGYAIKIHWKKLFIFQMAVKSPKIASFSKIDHFWNSLILANLNSSWKNSKSAILSDFRKKWTLISAIFWKSPRRRPKSPQLVFFDNCKNRPQSGSCTIKVKGKKSSVWMFAPINFYWTKVCFF